MSSVIAIDPGACSGVALFHDDRLVACNIARTPCSVAGGAPGVRLVIEAQRIYPRTPNPQSIVVLARNAGMWAGANLPCVAEWVEPLTWKGTAKKDWCTARILRTLTPEERAIVDFMTCAASYRHNAIDAVGIGLWACGRFARGMAKGAA